MNILFVTSNRIGDAVLSTGLLDYLLRKYPKARITLACGPAAAPLFTAVPNIERIIPLTKARGGLHWLKLWAACALRPWGIVVDLRRSALAWLLLTNERHIPGKRDTNNHRVVQLSNLFGLDEVAAPRLWLSRDQHEAAKRFIPAGPPVLALGPTANWRGKEWRGKNFVELARRLTAEDGILPGARIAVFGSAGERPAAAAVIEGIPKEQCIDLVGRLDLPTVAACFERCALYIGNDSGLMHLAAAVGIPTLGLFGPSRETEYAPWGPCTAVARTSIPFADLVNDPNFDHRTTDTLMDSLSVDVVEQAAQELWRRRPGKHPEEQAEERT
jgi:ADP-heptose:LPS heptosyltransferase